MHMLRLIHGPMNGRSGLVTRQLFRNNFLREQTFTGELVRTSAPLAGSSLGFSKPPSIYQQFRSLRVPPRNDDEDLSNPRERKFRIGGIRRVPPQEEDGSVQQQSSGPPVEDEKPSSASRALSGMGVVGSGLLLLGGKTKTLLVALKLTKLSTLGSMLASTAAYSFIFGPAYAAGMVGLLLLHESGHALTMRQLGYEYSPMVFLPFMGAVVGMKEPPRTAYDDARISIGGPVLGSLAAGGVAVAGVMTDSQLLIALADWGFMINLFNLLPIGALDGAHILGSLNRWFLVSALAGGFAAIYVGLITNPMFYLLMFLSTFQTYQRFFGEDQHHYQRPGYEMPRGQKIIIGSSYLALVMALIGAQSLNNKYRKSPAQIRAELEREAAMRGETIESGGMGETVLGWSKHLEDPEYFAPGSNEDATFDELRKSDPFFQKPNNNNNNRWA